jgi:hypothetical protein
MLSQRAAGFSDVVLEQRLEHRIGQQPGQRLGMLIAHIDHANAPARDGGQLGRMHQSLDRAIDHQGAAGQRGDDRGQLLQSGGRAGRPHDRSPGFEDGRQLDAESRATQPRRGLTGQLGQHGTALAFTKHGHGVAGLQVATREHVFKGMAPRGLQFWLQHDGRISSHTT